MLLQLEFVVARRAKKIIEARRVALFDQVLGMGVQAWLTGTDKDVFAPLGVRALFLAVTDGAITGIQND